MSTEKLLAMAVAEATSDGEDDDAYWERVWLLQKRDPGETWSLLLPLTEHVDPRVRALVPDVLRYLGGIHRPLIEESVAVFDLAGEVRVVRILRRGVGIVEVTHHHAGPPEEDLPRLSCRRLRIVAADDQIPVVVAIDARHDHVYLQVFGAGGRTLVAPRLAPLADAIRAASEAPTRIVGTAAKAVAAGLAGTAPAPIIVDAREAPDIGWVARIGAAVAEAQAPPKPQYLRAPDAQPQYAASLPRR